MATPTMVYRRYTDTPDGMVRVDVHQPELVVFGTAHVTNDDGVWEYKIVELEDGASPPEGWQASPSGAHTPAVAVPQPAPVVEHVAEPVVHVDPEAEHPAADIPELVALRAKAEAHGIKVDKRWGVQKLTALIAVEDMGDNGNSH